MARKRGRILKTAWDGTKSKFPIGRGKLRLPHPLARIVKKR